MSQIKPKSRVTHFLSKIPKVAQYSEKDDSICDKAN